MLKVLWVEDDKGNIDECSDDSFDELFGEPIVPTSFKEAYEYTKNHLDYDFVIIDIDLTVFPDFNEKYASDIKEEILFKEREDKSKTFAQLAGLVIFTKLLELGFPKERVVFLTASAGSENNTYDIFKKYFNAALMTLPEHIVKSADAPEKLSQKLKDKINNYLILRRGIIEACKKLKKQKNKLRFDKFCKDGKIAFLDIDDYLLTLENFLPLQDPTDKKTLYKLFIRTLAHEWEESVEPKKLDEKGSLAFSWVMKMTRNWIAHNSTAIFTNLTEKDVAYLFICNMRAMFDLDDEIQPYEKHLFSLFDTKNNPKNKIKNKDIPLIDTYVSYFNEKTNRTDVHNILHDLQNDKDKLKDKGDKFFITGLYDCFWFLTSPHRSQKDKAKPNLNNSNQVFISRYCTLEHFDYTKTDFLLEFSRHIYNRSFLQGE